jgi:hypothetical protein
VHDVLADDCLVVAGNDDCLLVNLFMLVVFVQEFLRLLVREKIQRIVWIVWILIPVVQQKFGLHLRREQLGLRVLNVHDAGLKVSKLRPAELLD